MNFELTVPAHPLSLPHKYTLVRLPPHQPLQSALVKNDTFSTLSSNGVTLHPPVYLRAPSSLPSTLLSSRAPLSLGSHPICLLCLVSLAQPYPSPWPPHYGVSSGLWASSLLFLLSPHKQSHVPSCLKTTQTFNSRVEFQLGISMWHLAGQLILRISKN